MCICNTKTGGRGTSMWGPAVAHWQCGSQPASPMATRGIWARQPQEQMAKLLTLWPPEAWLRDPPAHLLQRHQFPNEGGGGGGSSESWVHLQQQEKSLTN